MALPDYEGWACFAAVADSGSFTAAAGALGLSKASVSKAVSRLEASLGITLLHRSSRSVTVSTAGEGLLGEARAMVAAATAATEAARGDRLDLAGPVRLAAPMSFGIKVLGPPLAAFLERHPAVEIEVALSDARQDLIAEGIDLALRIAPLADSSLLVRTIAPVAASVLASPAYLASHGTPRHPLDLGGHRLIGYGHRERAAPLRFHRAREEATVLPTGPLFANNGDVMVPLLVAGGGIAVLPDFIVEEALASGALVKILTDWSLPQAYLHLLSPPSRLRPARVRALSDYLVEALKLSCAGRDSRESGD
ncbi:MULTISPECIES: LysR family transcriptional regulator [Sphingopyxis]|jgi:DNA-binding transcriptional LysR family regulator|uniref:LysR family transcriptional regulator n=1 Tax=Sphingopyxis TaxID=165697 RepID=UPI00086A6BDB|nr:MULTISPECIES: LysR family transcriptional regulator [Sphingopyxis]APW73341.1 LysR family transcriptional regulator [Sphingopyxis granuli]AVA14370.1 LysR family transcriptional regulator [Sphingopyxis sp. MG]ODU24999.1 MAG: LysR family transcriptional regulator [Sphingopyxis sp. SCN 67-31]QUM73741.1 LysR family transcriptional regulator [Sphingopyxis granuli]